jgi:hypothetical protein
MRNLQSQNRLVKPSYRVTVHPASRSTGTDLTTFKYQAEGVFRFPEHKHSLVGEECIAFFMSMQGVGEFFLS